MFKVKVILFKKIYIIIVINNLAIFEIKINKHFFIRVMFFCSYLKVTQVKTFCEYLLFHFIIHYRIS